MHERDAVLLIAAREIRVRARSRAFIWSTVVLVVGIAVGGVAAAHFSKPKPRKVGLSTSAVSQRPMLEAAAAKLGTKITVHEIGDAGADAVRSGRVHAVVRTTPTGIAVIVKRRLDPALLPVLTVLAQQRGLEAAFVGSDLDVARVVGVLAAAAPVVEAIEPPPAVSPERMGAAIASMMLIFMSIQFGAQFVAQGVVEEKSSRVVEVLLSTIRARTLLAGKVLGIEVVVLMQVLVILVTGLVTASAAGVLHGVPVGWATLSLLAWYLVGFTLYAVMVAALASLVSRQEDLASAVTPVVLLLMIPYMAFFTTMANDPDNGIVRALSFIPFFAPILMPVRAAMGLLPWWQASVSFLGALATIFVLVWIAGRIYENGVLRTGTRLPLREALRRH